MRHTPRTAWTGRASTVLVLGAVTLGALALAACQDLQPPEPSPANGGMLYGHPPPPPPPMETGFSPQDFAWSVNGGPGELAGRVAYRAVAGERWTCSGQVVALIPATRYSAERMQVLYGSQGRAIVPAGEVRGRNAARPGIDYGRYVRTATCDGRDAFRFGRLPVGPYFVIARARPRGHEAGAGEGVVIMQRLDVGAGLERLSLPAP